MISINSYIELKLSYVERTFADRSGRKGCSSRLPYIVVPNFPNLGLFTALRFLEWAAENPYGTISLPTGKTPEQFIKWTKYLLNNWGEKKVVSLMHENGLRLDKKPNLEGLQFIQIDEFYPINPKQRNSFYNYVMDYYIRGFGLDPGNALLINSEEIPLYQGMHFSSVFPDNMIDLSLRKREPKNQEEAVQQKSIFMIDNWCTLYEEKIRQKGGIGFFLGGIGPDGHIAFNTRGSDHNSTTRLTETNFETQAASASDLGGIEVSRNRLVITIGLGSITSNPEGASIIFAAGEAKAPIVKAAIENSPDNLYPATVLQRQKNARFYITEGASKDLSDSIDLYYKTGPWTLEKTERAVYDLCQRIDKYAHKLDLEDLENDPYCCMIPDLSLDKVSEVIESAKSKIGKGMEKQSKQVYLHTGPHHDDIMLGIFPVIIPHLREPDNDFYFSVLTSGFTAVTNMMIRYLLQATLDHIRKDKIRMLDYEDFFDKGYKIKWDKDVNHYLNKVAENNEQGRLRGICHRVVRAIVDIYRVRSKETLENQIGQIIHVIDNSYDGQKDAPDLQALKGMLREFEEELVWALYGVQVKKIKHLRLGFYTGDIFTQLPERKRDVEPILNMLLAIKPSVISLAFDPEGSGPDTHYKVLQAIAEALRQWSKVEDISGLKILGYRNVWYKFQPHEANVYTPVSLNSMAVLQSSFKDCYISQVNASFPSYEFDGPFSELSQHIWVEQFKKVQLILGKDFFYENEHPKYRATHGMIFHREMNPDEFLRNARKLEESMEGIK